MEKTQERKIVAVRFSPIGKSYYFDATGIDGLQMDDHIVVQTSRGWQIGKIVQFVEKQDLNGKSRFKPINRIATPEDLEKKRELDDRSEKAVAQAISSIKSLKIKGVKIISAEFSFDENMISYLYTTENDTNVRFNDVIQQVKDRFHVRKVDFHKIGPRDVAKFYCEMGACGMEERCCSRFLTKFDSISIRMAKKQGISLTPSDITGMCDRLRCCLNYEYCTYVESLKGMPKKNKMVSTPLGEGKVQDLAPLTRTVYVRIPNHGIKEFDVEEIKPITRSDSTESRSNQEQHKNRNKTHQDRKPKNNKNKNRRGNQRGQNKGKGHQ
jgi:cell fate regulator YaaT (PSP1 superfamily)